MASRDFEPNGPMAGLHGRSGLRGRLRRAVGRIGDLIVPPVCLACREPMTAHDTLCAACWSRIDFIRPPLCDRLGVPLPFATGQVSLSAAAIADPPVYDRARAVAHYSGLMRRLVHDLKFHDRDDLVGLLGGWLTETGKELLAEADLVVPVPLSRMRLLMPSRSSVSGQPRRRWASRGRSGRTTSAARSPCVRTAADASTAGGSS
jgi:hypothetical protein